MSEFYVSISRKGMAQQIAALINQHNKLYKNHTSYSVMNNNVDYFVEIVHNVVVGCANLSKKFHNSSEIKHICVEPKFRRNGIAKKLVLLAIANCSTEYVYMRIRDDNLPSLMLAKTLGFVPVGQYWSADHFVITVGRKRNYEYTCGK